MQKKWFLLNGDGFQWQPGDEVILQKIGLIFWESYYLRNRRLDQTFWIQRTTLTPCK